MSREELRRHLAISDEVFDQENVAVNLMRSLPEFDKIFSSIRSRVGYTQSESATQADAWAQATQQPVRYAPAPVAARAPDPPERRRSRNSWVGVAAAAAAVTLVAAQHTTVPPGTNPGRRERLKSYYSDHFARGSRTAADPDNVVMTDSAEAAYEHRRGNRNALAAGLGGAALVGLIWLGTEIFDDDDEDDNLPPPVTTSQTATPSSTPSPTSTESGSPTELDKEEKVNEDSDLANDQEGEEDPDADDDEETTTERILLGGKTITVKTINGKKFYLQELERRGNVVWQDVTWLLKHTGDKKIKGNEMWGTVNGVGAYNKITPRGFHEMDVGQTYWVQIPYPKS